MSIFAGVILGLGGTATFAANNVSGGPDLIGVAAVITAVSGLIATIGMLYLNLRRSRGGRDET